MHHSRLCSLVIDCKHQDIKTDDLDAEAARLEKLGASRVAKVRDRCG